MNPKWHFRVRREAPLFPAWGVTESLAHVKKPLKIDFNYKNVIYVNYEWLFLMSEEKELEELLKKKLNEDLSYYHDYVKRQYKTGEALKKYVRKIAGKNHSRKEVKELHNYINKMLEFYAFWWLAVPAGRFLEEEVRKILDKYDLNDFFGDLIRSSQVLELSKDQVDLLKIAREIKGIPFGKLSKEQKKRLEEHSEKFGWLSTTYHLGEPQTVQSLYKKAQKSDPDKELKEMEKKKKRYERVINDLKKKLTKKEMEVINVMQEVIFSRNYQKETVNKCQHRSEPFLKRCAEEIGISWEDFLYLTPREAEEALVSKKLPKKEEIETRKKGYAVIIEDGIVFATHNIKEFIVEAKERDDFQSASDFIKGQPGYKGIVEGKVRIIMKKKQLNEFKAGKILVTSMTSIDFVPIMKKARGIITDEGGITCHAAIVSRELNIPCVIGTKIATKILKDGDLVEVDANTGVVKILKRAK